MSLMTSARWECILDVFNAAVERPAAERAAFLVEACGGDAPTLSLDDAPALMSEERAEEIVVLDDALTRLAGVNDRAARVVECRFFGGLTIEETAHALATSPTTVKRDWRLAKTWLRREARL